MKTIFLALIYFILITPFAAAQRGGASPDTLLFDGEAVLYNNPSDNSCKLKVTYLKGDVIGTAERSEVIWGCLPENINVAAERVLQTGDMVVMNGSPVKTGNNSYIELEAQDGSIIRIGPNSSADFNCNTEFIPGNSRISVKLVLGTIWAKVTHALGGDAMNIKTSRAIAGIRGTIFSIETKLEDGVYTDILRTYEGSVEFRGNPENKIDKEEIRKQSDSLQKAYREGKITIEELTSKMKELVNPVEKAVDEYMVMVEGGYESVIRGTDPPTQPASLTEDPNAWYNDKNFGK
jgi:hypothetical protein